jgi:hypothetical protein
METYSVDKEQEVALNTNVSVSLKKRIRSLTYLDEKNTTIKEVVNDALEIGLAVLEAEEKLLATEHILESISLVERVENYLRWLKCQTN